MSVVTATIKSEGKKLSMEYQLMNIEVSREINRIPTAELILLDGNPAKQEFTLSDEAFFEPGKEIEIQLRYEGGKGSSKAIFKGLVVRHNLEVNSQESFLSVEMKDKALGLTKGRNSAVFEKKADSDIIKSLISEGGAKAGKIAKTALKHPEIVQYYCSNWDFILSRADVNNLLVAVEDGEVSLHKIEIKGAAKHTFEYGITEIYGFEMEADASQQYASIASVAWDIKTQKLTKASKAKEFALAQSNLKGKSIASKFGGKEYQLTSPVQLDPKEIQAWADAKMTRTRMSFMRGVVTVPGDSGIKLMDVLELKGIGKRFNGKTLVTGIQHTVNQEGWQTHIQFGLPADPYSYTSHIVDAPAAGLLPAVQGLQIGLVDAFEEDKDAKEFRVRVILPGVDEKKGKIWARLASPDAGKARGYFFRPEKGDEVVLGFFNDDPRQAVILGALFSSKNVPPKGWEKLSKDNAFKGIVSKSGIKMEIDDKDQKLSFETSAKQSIVLDEKKKSISISDLNKNTITLDDKGITIKSSDKLTIEAKGDLSLKGKKILINGSSGITLKSSKVEVK